MKNTLPELSEAQWGFMAVLDILGGNSLIEVVGILAPLLPGPLFDLLDKTEIRGWMKREGDDRLALTKDLPQALQNRLNKINTRCRLGKLIERILKENLLEKIDQTAMILLFEGGGRLTDASQIGMEQAHQSLVRGENEIAKNFFQQSLDRVFDLEDLDAKTLFIQGTLQFSNVCFFLGQSLNEIPRYLHRAQELAGQVGDRRSHGMINLHFGRLFYVTGLRDKALVAFSLGHEEIKELGDDDIQTQSAAFIGIYFFMQGKFTEAVNHFEKAEVLYQADSPLNLSVSLTPLFLGYCTIYLGRFHQAIGSLDLHWRLARERSDWSLATSIRAVLGTVLVLLNNEVEGLQHLKHAREEAQRHGNSAALHLCGGGIALYYFRQGKLKESFEESKKAMEIASQSGLVQQFASPWVLELLYEYHRQGYEPVPYRNYHEVLNRIHPQKFDRIWKELNIHLQGVVLRLRAKEKMDDGLYPESVWDDLQESADCLRQSGDPVQLSKSLLESARWELAAGDRQKARQLAQQAWRELGGYADIFFPDDFRALLDERGPLPETEHSREAFLKNYLEMLEILIPTQNPDEIMSQVVRATNRFIGAERGGLFWFPEGRFTREPELRAACNLTDNHVKATDFKKSLSLVLDAFRTQKPILVRPDNRGTQKESRAIQAILCIPLKIEGTVKAVIYHNNSYLNDAFDFLDVPLLRKMGQHHSMIIERLMDYLRIKNESRLFNSNKTHHFEHGDQQPIITGSSVVLKLLKQAEQVAASDSTVLISGESGTGKELLADLIHQKSLRSDEPLIIVDAATIPENLFESELFGHEKGAFTGAERRKVGYIELAGKGTLFLDEIGELPLHIQTKLLRTLQEKTFARVGGTARIKSDFRLITATNRSLEKEMTEGRFREDLYYRLNVVPLTLPPLRDRGDDAFKLAQQFVGRFCRKHGREPMLLSAIDKKHILKYIWPGNVRELMNVVERAVILSTGDQLELNLPSDKLLPVSDPFGDKPTLDEIQRRYITYIIEQTGGKISGSGGVAEILGLKRSSVYARMNSLGMKR
ncbi:MAG: sigma 54-interacting transcriptional regulator [Deltaproteobacteria bacterium]|jgi:transcriptional regulator with GAF, ATPase, and Fis domain/tetratricopeptide (TPR) repeat protein|nr:sigma 54-interacting transcriptional regulator [Deltaproteobacteria bacterium]MBT4637631.1 sigma 54-interacting transcriptional regulator [Deltaproteobacteria bacterium]MBT6498872.1 sigma 54-interacting transcriptional regulator [Deltaproteobacteria bacterium]MBT7153442.1 sigma 54-interacting transcriptional regulator [Deltaproteobacteria bacterium]MBT7711294.1 sigma 54-interacting transcriptional regulator [Deltaproteobacteria bacterium]